jgi:type III secretion protein R
MSVSPLALVAVMIAAGLLPFAMVMLTSFVKMAVVLSIVRSAIGVPQLPPNSVVTGLALVLSLVVMTPVASQMANRLEAEADVFANGKPADMLSAVERVAEPLRRFLQKHTDERHLRSVAAVVQQSEEEVSWRSLVPAFVIGQLHEAFHMGFLIFLPFLVLDMVVASVLLSLGMHMLSPVTISLPFKLLLFALADGWTLLGSSLMGPFMNV